MGGMSVASAEGIATLQSLCQEVGCPYHDELGSTTCCVALVVLWMGLHQEKFPLLATSLQAAAGVQGRPRIAKPRMMKENGAKKRTAHTGSFRQQTQRTRGDAKKTMLRNGLDYFKESMLS